MKHKFANNNTLSPQKRFNQLKYDAKKKYGLPLEMARFLRQQNCEICKKKASKMCIDHKEIGSYRGILCQQCNTRLGWFEKNQKIILDYIQRPNIKVLEIKKK